MGLLVAGVCVYLAYRVTLARSVGQYKAHKDLPAIILTLLLGLAALGGLLWFAFEPEKRETVVDVRRVRQLQLERERQRAAKAAPKATSTAAATKAVEKKAGRPVRRPRRR